MKKICIGLVMAASIILLGGCSGGEAEQSDTKSSSDFAKTDDSRKAEFVTVAEKTIKEVYGLSDISVDMSKDKLKVYAAPDEVNAETGEKYSNVVNGISDFTVDGKTYPFTLLYNLKDDGKSYSVIYLYSKYDESKGIDTKLESEQ